MDQASLVETVRRRLRLRLQGLQLADSKCTSSEEDLVEMNLHILGGEAGWEVVLENYDLLLSDPATDANWCPHFGLPFATCAPLLVASMCDSWRRLVLPYQNITCCLLQLAVMDVQDGLELLWREQRKVAACSLCRDRFFAMAPRQFNL